MKLGRGILRAFWIGAVLITNSAPAVFAQSTSSNPTNSRVSGQISPAQVQPASTNLALRLEGAGDYVELPPDVFNDFTEATVEAWVKWNSFGNRYQRIFNYGQGGRDISLTTLTGTRTLWFVIADPATGLQGAKAEDLLRAGEWTHVAGVAGSGGMKLYLNGTLVATHPYTGCFKTLGAGNASRLGQTVTDGVDDTPFDGELAEVRVWKTARSEVDIRDNLFKKLTGKEPGLAALWNFANVTNGVVNDLGPGAHHGKLMGNAKVVPGQLPVPSAARQLAPALELDGNGSYVGLPANHPASCDSIQNLHGIACGRGVPAIAPGTRKATS